jgi:regulator of protease activity HflC (stomatin/prohibitin superfamily)
MESDEHLVVKNSPTTSELTGCESCLFYGLNFIICLFTAFLACCCGFYTVEPLEAVVITAFGKIVKTQTEPGLHCFLPCCTAFNHISTKMRTLDLPGSSVPDARGSPLNVSAIVTYSVVAPVEALYHCNDLTKFVTNQGLDVLRRVCTKFPFRSNDPNEASLQDDGVLISKFLKEMLHARCKVAGVEIQRMDLTEIAYHPEVA